MGLKDEAHAAPPSEQGRPCIRSTRTPSTVSVPALGISRTASNPSRVDLPAPLSPRMSSVSPPDAEIHALNCLDLVAPKHERLSDVAALDKNAIRDMGLGATCWMLTFHSFDIQSFGPPAAKAANDDGCVSQFPNRLGRVDPD